jgi:hypothetical protein
VRDLEDLLEGYNPEYVRSCQQHTPDVYAATLSNGERGLRVLGLVHCRGDVGENSQQHHMNNDSVYSQLPATMAHWAAPHVQWSGGRRVLVLVHCQGVLRMMVALVMMSVYISMKQQTSHSILLL